ncbi:MAG: hypothetical protein JWM19_5208 [Actinomycetia bacterium]|nr:hypothetical protein [Actinomycetes bacterium]
MTANAARSGVRDMPTGVSVDGVYQAGGAIRSYLFRHVVRSEASISGCQSQL